MNENLGKKAASGLMWMFSERIIAQFVSFVVSVVLARILMPEEYGIVSLVLVYINIANVFVTSGLGQSLIKDKTTSSIDYNTVFITSFFISWVLYFILFCIAPYVATFFDNQSLTLVLRVISFKIPIAAINTVQSAYISRNMQFRKYFFSTLIGTVTSGIIGIIMAIHGFGVWALVAQYLLNSAIDTGVLFVTVKWKPRLQFSYTVMKKHLSFGIKLTCSSLINTIYLEMQSLFIGKVYTEKELGLYKRGNQFPSLIVNNVNSAVGSVMFPTFSKVADNRDALKSMMRRSMTLTSYIITPMMIGMIAVARQLVLVLLTEKWFPCVFFVQMACLSYMSLPIQTANCQAILAKGRSDIYLVMEIIKKSFGVAILLYTLHKGVPAIAVGAVCAVYISAIVSMIPNKALMNYSLREQVLDLMPGCLMSAIMFVPIYLMNGLPIPSFVLLILQVLTGAAIYCGLSVLFKVDSFYYLLRLVKSYISK